MRQTSTLRRLVEQELARRNTTLERFLAESVDGGQSLNAAATALAHVTGIPVSNRTIYRWHDTLERVAS